MKFVSPEKIEEILPLTFTLCNSKIYESRTITIAKNGVVESVTKGGC